MTMSTLRNLSALFFDSLESAEALQIKPGWRARSPLRLELAKANSSLESFRVKQLEEQASALRNSVICAFNQLLDLKDLNTGVHSTRLAEWGLRVGQEIGLSEAELSNLEVAALLHDIGKVGIPDSILHKPGRLDADEYAMMKRHPEYGWVVLRRIPGFERAA